MIDIQKLASDLFMPKRYVRLKKDETKTNVSECSNEQIFSQYPSLEPGTAIFMVMQDGALQFLEGDI